MEVTSMEMKKVSLLLLFIQLSIFVCGQRIQIILPAQPVVLGTAFQVQYVITDPAEITNINTPVFDSFRLVSGPNYYKGNAMADGRMQPIENITYTLVPLRAGNLRVGGLTANFKTAEEKSRDGIVVVVPPAKASFSARSSYTDISLYAPASKGDLQKLIGENLFVRTEVSKNTCYEGEPIVVTFKLYSRLQSSSEAEKSPAFYGFSVLDLVNIDEAHTAVETIDGKVFNTSILRQVQLYPVQSGRLTIDPMYIQNEIEFNDTVQHRKITINKELVTKPMTILVKPLPEKKPESFTGAVGKFSIEARLDQPKTLLNGSNKLILTLSGKGNFIQFGTPVIAWPKGLEVFEPEIKDRVVKQASVMQGSRTYEFSFTADSLASYTIDSISFGFFNVDSGRFQTIRTAPLRFAVIQDRLPNRIAERLKASYNWLIWAVLALLAIVIGYLLWYNRRKKGKSRIQKPTEKRISESYAERLQTPEFRALPDKEACLFISQSISDLISARKTFLQAEQLAQLEELQKNCRLLIYSSMKLAGEREALTQKAIDLFKNLQSG